MTPFQLTQPVSSYLVSQMPVKFQDQQGFALQVFIAASWATKELTKSHVHSVQS
jgi:hypothetical protein